MGDAGEGLVDAESRIAERREEVERARQERKREAPKNPDALRALESLKLGRAELQRQFDATTDERRRKAIVLALEDLDKKIGAGPRT